MKQTIQREENGKKRFYIVSSYARCNRLFKIVLAYDRKTREKMEKMSPSVGIQLSSSSCPQQRVVFQVCSRAMYFLPPPYLPTPHARYFCASDQMEETADPHIA